MDLNNVAGQNVNVGLPFIPGRYCDIGIIAFLLFACIYHTGRELSTGAGAAIGFTGECLQSPCAALFEKNSPYHLN